MIYRQKLAGGDGFLNFPENGKIPAALAQQFPFKKWLAVSYAHEVIPFFTFSEFQIWAYPVQLPIFQLQCFAQKPWMVGPLAHVNNIRFHIGLNNEQRFDFPADAEPLALPNSEIMR